MGSRLGPERTGNPHPARSPVITTASYCGSGWCFVLFSLDNGMGERPGTTVARSGFVVRRVDSQEKIGV